ncbi:MAG TPA: hydrogenase expression/formation protein HypE [Candidatus Kryptonia bacterium]|nr:hydrogenase expression/formation protein HypE [Candidatus Kryptonia bacterium]
MPSRLESLLACPLPIEDDAIVQMAHGGGGRKMANLIERLFLPAFDNPTLSQLGDGAVIEVGGERLAFSTDTFVVSPAFFPGGNIGSLAIHGTANDLAVCGAKPMGFSVGLVLEEGFSVEQLRRIIASLADASEKVGAPILTGDTKVVERGKGDGIYINTSGIGRVRPGVNVAPNRAAPGDVVLVSGPVGDHGIAIMAARNGIEFETALLSDSAAVLPLVSALLDVAPDTKVMRDPTRGGLATALCEIADASRVGIRIDEAAVPVRREVRAACEVLGFDPLYVACEGRFLAIVPPHRAAAALTALRTVPDGADACRIGEVTAEDGGRVVLRTRIGSHRRIDRLSGEQLPRIC